MNSELNNKLNKLKEYHSSKIIEELNKRIYSYNIDENFTLGLDNNYLLYVHVKLHNMFQNNVRNNDKVSKIKIMHDLIIKNLKNHQKNDDLDN